MTEVQEWNGSRWEFMKSQSNWHFDYMKQSLPGKDSFTYVCRFEYDFTDIVNKYIPIAHRCSWGSRNNYNDKILSEGLYSATAEEQDLIVAGADPKQEVFCRVEAVDEPIFQKISDWLGIEKPGIKFHNQTTGQMLHLHIDNFAARPERENSFKVTEMDNDPSIMRRFAIMLADWKPGQIFQLGNANFYQWKSGECITWEWQDIPHCTANMGWWDRPMLQITGFVTERTKEVLKKADEGWVVNL